MTLINDTRYIGRFIKSCLVRIIKRADLLCHEILKLVFHAFMDNGIIRRDADLACIHDAAPGELRRCIFQFCACVNNDRVFPAHLECNRGQIICGRFHDDFAYGCAARIIDMIKGQGEERLGHVYAALKHLGFIARENVIDNFLDNLSGLGREF